MTACRRWFQALCTAASGGYPASDRCSVRLRSLLCTRSWVLSPVCAALMMADAQLSNIVLCKRLSACLLSSAKRQSNDTCRSQGCSASMTNECDNQYGFATAAQRSLLTAVYCQAHIQIRSECEVVTTVIVGRETYQ